MVDVWDTEVVDLQNKDIVIKHRNNSDCDKLAHLEVIGLQKWPKWEVLLY